MLQRHERKRRDTLLNGSQLSNLNMSELWYCKNTIQSFTIYWSNTGCICQLASWDPPKSSPEYRQMPALVQNNMNGLTRVWINCWYSLCNPMMAISGHGLCSIQFSWKWNKSFFGCQNTYLLCKSQSWALRWENIKNQKGERNIIFILWFHGAWLHCHNVKYQCFVMPLNIPYRETKYHLAPVWVATAFN